MGEQRSISKSDLSGQEYSSSVNVHNNTNNNRNHNNNKDASLPNNNNLSNIIVNNNFIEPSSNSNPQEYKFLNAANSYDSAASSTRIRSMTDESAEYHNGF
eukprot:UN11765